MKYIIQNLISILKNSRFAYLIEAMQAAETARLGKPENELNGDEIIDRIHSLLRGKYNIENFERSPGLWMDAMSEDVMDLQSLQEGTPEWCPYDPQDQVKMIRLLKLWRYNDADYVPGV